MIEQAFAAFLKYHQLLNEEPEIVAALRQAYTEFGIKGYLRRRIERWKSMSYIRPTVIAVDFAYLGEKELAIEWLQKAYEWNDPGLLSLKTDPGWDCLRSDPRFIGLLKKVGLNQ